MSESKSNLYRVKLNVVPRRPTRIQGCPPLMSCHPLTRPLFASSIAIFVLAFAALAFA